MFVLSTLGAGSIVVLPSSQLHILSKPESQVNAFEVQLETWQPLWTIGNKNMYEKTINCAFNAVRKHLTKDVGRFAEAMMEELAASIEGSWGHSEEWKNLNVYESCSLITAQAMCRLYFGLPLCRDPLYLKSSPSWH